MKETKQGKKLEALFGKQQQGLVDVALSSSETGAYDGRSVESVLISRGYNAGDKSTGC